MTLLVPSILVGLWVAVLLPPCLRGRGESGDSVVSFQRHLSILERTSPTNGWSVGPELVSARGHVRSTSNRVRPSVGRMRAQRRRRDVLVGLTAMAVFTFGGAVVLGGSLWLVNLATVAALGGYVYLLVQARKAVEERRQKVRYLPVRRAEPTPAYALRRAAR